MREFDRRVSTDRRKKTTPAFSRYTIRGQRRTFRRKRDRQGGGYVDHYHPGLLFIITLIMGLTVLDAMFTMMILDDGGWEVNPVVGSVIQLYGDGFWVWKFMMVSSPLILLCIHSNFRTVKPLIVGICVLHIFLITYQVFLLIF